MGSVAETRFVGPFSLRSANLNIVFVRPRPEALGPPCRMSLVVLATIKGPVWLPSTAQIVDGRPHVPLSQSSMAFGYKRICLPALL